jgi:hypothetical protein
MAVDVLHRHGRQVRAFPDPGTEVRHHERVGTEIVEEMTVGRYVLHLDDTGQDFGENTFGAVRH